MFSAPKYMHHLVDNTGQWIGGSDDWEVISSMKGILKQKEKLDPTTSRKKYQVITFHPMT